MYTPSSSSRRSFRLLQLATVAVLAGRAWQHLYWDAPWRALLWDQNWMQGLVEGLLGIGWDDWVTNPAYDQLIQLGIQGMGVFFILAIPFVFLLTKYPNWSRAVLLLAGFFLLLLAWLTSKDRFLMLGLFMEYTLQWSAPVFLVWVSRVGFTKVVLNAMKVAAALTFTAHGLYAAGVYPRPGHFVEMTMNITGLDNAEAARFLTIAAVLDFIVSVLIFVPGRVGRYALLYMVAWGLATTMARIFGYINFMFFENFLVQWVHESVYRFPHFLLPLLVWLYTTSRNKERPK